MYIYRQFRLLIFDSYSSYFIPQFDRICTENNIILFCISPYLFYLLQLFDIGYFAVLKYIYGRFVSDFVYREYNYIDKYNFLVDYQYIQLEIFQSTNSTIKNSFTTSSLIPVDTEKIFSKFNISLRISTPPNSRPTSRSSQFIPKIPKTVVQLQKQTLIFKNLLKQQSNSPPNPSKTILDQIIKDHCIVLHNTALLAQKNADLRATNKKKRQKRNRSNRQILCNSGITVEENLQLVRRLDLLDKAIQIDSHIQSKLPNQAAGPATRAPPRYSGCREIGHRINSYKNRYI